MDRYLYLIPLLPLLASAFNLLISRKYFPDKAHIFAILGVGGSFILSVLVFKDLYDNGVPLHQHLWSWIASGSFHAEVGLYADQLTAVMLVMVTFVSLLVHIYSIGYMHGDPSYYRFFSWLPLFVFTMLCLVLADNYLMIFFGWEGVGLCSYLLIGYYYKRRSAGNAAKKAFIVNRIGDVGFGLGIMLIFTTFGTISFAGDHGVFAQVAEGGTSTRILTAIALLLFTGAIGKSAQFPLHVWLPDAMEGPTPVSALIHAATMVTAGIYLVARSNPIFMQAPDAMFVVAVIGCFTAFLGASIATVQNDIKRVDRLFDRQPARIHGAGARRRRLGDRHLPPGRPRLFQGLPLPRIGFGHPRHARRAEHSKDGRPAQVHADHLLHLPDRVVCQRGCLPLRRVLVERRDHHRRLGKPGLSALRRRAHGGGAHYRVSSAPITCSAWCS